MGPYEIRNSSFHGTVTATGVNTGGIAGSGYTASSAPNTPGATIENCYVTGTITGTDAVGGIFRRRVWTGSGMESGVHQK